MARVVGSGEGGFERGSRVRPQGEFGRGCHAKRAGCFPYKIAYCRLSVYLRSCHYSERYYS